MCNLSCHVSNTRKGVSLDLQTPRSGSRNQAQYSWCLEIRWNKLLYLTKLVMLLQLSFKKVKSVKWFIFYCMHFFSFDGRVVAKLPFVPHSWIQGLSHRNLMGTDFTDCSFIFLYILCTMSVRQVYIKFLLISVCFYQFSCRL